MSASSNLCVLCVCLCIVCVCVIACSCWEEVGEGARRQPVRPHSCSAPADPPAPRRVRALRACRAAAVDFAAIRRIVLPPPKQGGTA